MITQECPKCGGKDLHLSETHLVKYTYRQYADTGRVCPDYDEKMLGRADHLNEAECLGCGHSWFTEETIDV
jgi:hypothetical protein